MVSPAWQRTLRYLGLSPDADASDVRWRWLFTVAAALLAAFAVLRLIDQRWLSAAFITAAAVLTSISAWRAWRDHRRPMRDRTYE